MHAHTNALLSFNVATHGRVGFVDSEEITKSKFNTMIGLVDRERVDEELYDDFETAKAREVFLCYTFV